MKTWRNVPPIFLVALVIDGSYSVAHLMQRLLVTADERSYRSTDRWQLAATGVWGLWAVLTTLGCFQIARQRAGREATAARLAGIGLGGSYLFGMGFSFLLMFDKLPYSHGLFLFEGYMLWGFAALGAIGLAIAGLSHMRSTVLAGLTLCMLGHLPPLLNEPLMSALGLHDMGAHAFYAITNILHVVGTLLLAIAASGMVEAPRQGLAVRGFNRAASALWLRIIAAAVAMVLTLIAVGSRGEGSMSVLKLAMMAGLIVNFLSFTMFGIGGIDLACSELDGVRRYAAGIAAAASLWCAGVMFEQIPGFYQMLYGTNHDNSEAITALSVAMPIVGTLSVAVFGMVISGFARARNDMVLAGQASSAGTAYVILMLASIGISGYLLEEAKSATSGIGMMIVAAGCGFIAQLVFSRVCRAASFSIEMAPGLPVAKINAP